jgi:hypothetical protein
LGKFFKEFGGVGETDRAACIIEAKDEKPASGVGKSAEDFELVVMPSGFPLDGLVFGHRKKKLEERRGKEEVFTASGRC